jgi:prolyl-tRNA synthetase
MKSSQFFISTLKEAPQDAELISHQLMIRAGFIKKLSSGLYSWMPIGLRVLKKIESIIRDEMAKADAIELLMPAIQPADLWQESDRWEQFGPQMLKIKDRHDNEFCFGPTHEEVITDIVRKEIKSYKQLPINFYQIQTKFRDEIRPRFGVMRAREFMMKDSYSFHANSQSLDDTYKKMYEAYTKIFGRIKLDFRPVKADTGAIGGETSHEFHVLADSGEDLIAYSDESDYAANIEMATTTFVDNRKSDISKLEKVLTENVSSIESLVQFFHCEASKILKAVAFIADKKFYLCFVSGDREINLVKLKKQLNADQLFPAKDEEVLSRGLCPGFIGPDKNFKEDMEVLYDHSLLRMQDMVCGANEINYHFKNFNFTDDLSYVDISNVKEGDISPDGKGQLKFCRGIEVGHIFQLGRKYTTALQASFLNENGVSEILTMGCYGIGVSRIVAAAVEQNNDDNGMILPDSIAPFELVIIPIGINKSETVKSVATKTYEALKKIGIDVLLDDRDMRPGIMFAESDLMGIPHRLVIGEKSLADGEVEYKSRTMENPEKIKLTDIEDHLKSKIELD